MRIASKFLGRRKSFTPLYISSFTFHLSSFTFHLSPFTSHLSLLTSHFSHLLTNLVLSAPHHCFTILISHPIPFSTLQTSPVPIIVVSRADRQNGSFVSKDPPSVLGHLLKICLAPFSDFLVWESTEILRKPQNHTGVARYHRKSSSPKGSVSVASTGRYRKKPASTSSPAMTSRSTTMSWTTSSCSG